MYHIKTDKRSKASAEEIAKGLYRCLETSPLSAVTVSDLYRETGISRATFYRLFDTPEDVLIYEIDSTMDWIYQYHEVHKDEPPIKVFEGVINQGLENHKLMGALVKNGRFDLLHEYTERSFRIFKDFFASYFKDMDPIEEDYVFSSMAMNMVSNLSTWIRRGRMETAEQLIQYTKRYIQVMQIMTDESHSREGDH